MPIDRLAVRLDTSLEFLVEHAAGAPPARVLATVVATAGSTYRKSGARMLILGDGSYRGLLSGGCLEADLKLHALEVLKSGVARAVEYDMRGPDDILFGIGAGCEGAMRVLLEPAGPDSPAAAALACAARAAELGEPTCLVALHECADLAIGTYHVSRLHATALAPTPTPAFAPALAAAVHDVLASRNSRAVTSQSGGGRVRAFVQYLAPPPHLLICGAGPDAEPVVSAARALGWRVSVVDHRPHYAVAARFPGASVTLCNPSALLATVAVEHCHAAVVMSHHLLTDAAYLRELANAKTPTFVGLLGPEARRRRLAAELGGTAEKLRASLRGPVGLDLGAVTPEGIALAIVSQIHAWLAGRGVDGAVALGRH